MITPLKSVPWKIQILLGIRTRRHARLKTDGVQSFILGRIYGSVILYRFLCSVTLTYA
jgi:hypothetical protein